MTSTDIILIIGAVSLGIQNAITAWKVQAIKQSVDGAATAQTAMVATKAATIDTRDETIKALTKTLSEAQETAKLLAQHAGPVKRKP